MVGVSPILMAPAIAYGTGGSVYYNTSADSNTCTTGGTNYRVQYWNNPNATSTYPVNWDMGTASTAVVEMDYIQYQTLDMPYTQIAPGVGYTVRVARYDNGANWAYYHSPPVPIKTPAERLKEILNSRMAPGILSSCKPLGYCEDIRERRARETLHRVLGDDKYRDFVRRGHVSVRAKSGLIYQIFPGHDFTKVYDNGKMVDRLCVVLNGGFPPTDSLIMRYLMILNNEQQFRSYAIKHGAMQPTVAKQADQRSLPEIFREMKKVA